MQFFIYKSPRKLTFLLRTIRKQVFGKQSSSLQPQLLPQANPYYLIKHCYTLKTLDTKTPTDASPAAAAAALARSKTSFLTCNALANFCIQQKHKQNL